METNPTRLAEALVGLPDVELDDLLCFGRRTRLAWSKLRWRCPNPSCAVVTFVEIDDRISSERTGMLEAGDPKGEVRNAWHAKEVVKSIYAIDDQS